MAARASSRGRRTTSRAQYRSVPIGITVEGANILTRNLMIYGQGAIRAHPYMLKEMLALSDEDEERGLKAFDEHFWGHVGHALANAFRTLRARLDGRPCGAGAEGRRLHQPLAAAVALHLGLRDAVGPLAADARRRTEAQGDDLGPPRRHPVGDLSPRRGAEALRGRGPAGGRQAARRVHHAEGLEPHRARLQRRARQPSGALGGGADPRSSPSRWACPSRSPRTN